MGRSQETYNKKEKEKKKLQKRKDKAARKEERKAESGRSFEDMIAYSDEFGNLTSTPPDPSKREEVIAEDIVLGARNNVAEKEDNAPREGRVTFFNDSKGYGFIKDKSSGDDIFVHVNGLIDNIMENDKVTFETERGPKGLNAVNVKVIR